MQCVCDKVQILSTNQQEDYKIKKLVHSPTSSSIMPSSVSWISSVPARESISKMSLSLIVLDFRFQSHGSKTNHTNVCYSGFKVQPRPLLIVALMFPNIDSAASKEVLGSSCDLREWKSNGWGRRRRRRRRRVLIMLHPHLTDQVSSTVDSFLTVLLAGLTYVHCLKCLTDVWPRTLGDKINRYSTVCNFKHILSPRELCHVCWWWE